MQSKIGKGGNREERRCRPTYLFHRFLLLQRSICFPLCPLPPEFDCWRNWQFSQKVSTFIFLPTTVWTEITEHSYPKISPLLRRERLCSRRLEGKVVENKCRFAFRSRVSLSLSFEFEDPSIFLPSRSLKKYYGEERNTELKLKRWN